MLTLGVFFPQSLWITDIQQGGFCFAIDEDALRLIRKGAKTSTDREAIRILLRHNILSIATWVAGFSEQTDRDLLRGLKQLISFLNDRLLSLGVALLGRRQDRVVDDLSGYGTVASRLGRYRSGRTARVEEPTQSSSASTGARER